MTARLNPTRAWGAGLALLLGAAVGPAHADQATWTKERFMEYAKLFNAEDVHFADYYTPDIVYPHITAGVLHGRNEIIDFYETKLWKSGVRETREPTAIIIDNPEGSMAVEYRMIFTCDPGRDSAKLPSGEVIKAGEKYQGSSTMIYGIKGNLISSIRGSLNGPGKITRVESK